MLKLVKSSATIVPRPKKYIKVLFNDGKCYKCNKNDNLHAVVDNISYCGNCKINVRIIKYVDEKEYLKMVVDEPTIQRDSYSNFVKTSEFI